MTLEKRILNLEQVARPGLVVQVVIQDPNDPLWCTVDGVRRLMAEVEAEGTTVKNISGISYDDL